MSCKKMFKEDLLAALDEPEVQEKLQSLLAIDSEVPIASSYPKIEDSYRAELAREKELVEQYRRQFQEAQERVSLIDEERKRISLDNNRVSAKYRELENEFAESRVEWQRELHDIKAAYEQKLQQCHQEVEKWQENQKTQEAMAAPFAEALHIYQQVQSLSPELKKRVQAYFKSYTPVSFIVCTGQENNLLSLWDIAKEENKNCSVEDKRILLALLNYCIERVNDSCGMPRYALCQDKEGERFDSRLHSRSADSSPHSGPIQKVILPGIVQVDTGAVKRPSVVRV